MKKILILFLVGLFSSTSWAQGPDYYYFADSVIGIFSDIRDASPAPEGQTNNGQNPSLNTVLTDSVRKGKAYDRVAVQLGKFKNSKDKGIKQAVDFLSIGLFALQNANSNVSNYLEKLLNDPKLQAKSGTVSRRLAELTAANEEAWKMYDQSSTMLTYALIEGAPALASKEDLEQLDSEKKLTKLLITKSERDLLKSRLQKSFGSVLIDINKAGLADLPAIYFWNFLNDENWKSAQE